MSEGATETDGEVTIGTRAKALGLGALFVLFSVGLWWLFMAAIWRAGRGLIWEADSSCAQEAAGNLLERFADFFVGYNDCANLHWTFGVLALFAALWVSTRAFFPPRYPPEHAG